MKRSILIASLALMLSIATMAQLPSPFYTGIRVGAKSVANKALITKITAAGNKASAYSGTTLLSFVNPDTITYKSFGMYRGDSIYQKPGSYTSLYQFKNKRTVSNVLKALKFLGSQVKGYTLGMELGTSTTGFAMTNNTIYWSIVLVTDTVTITSFQYNLTIQGVYTGSNINGMAWYGASGSTLTKVTETTNDATFWTKTAGAYTSVNLPAPILVIPGIYYIACLYCQSAQTTAPSLQTCSFGIMYNNAGYGNSHKIGAYTSANTSFPASLDASTLIANAYAMAITYK